MKSTYLSLTLVLLTLTSLTSRGPDTPKPKVEVTDLSFKTTITTLQPGVALQLIATVTPSGAKVTFTSDNTAVATVSETRLVKAVVLGAAIITTRTGDRKATRVIAVAEAKNVIIFNKLDKQEYPSGSTIDYVATISEKKARSCDPELFSSVFKTEQYSGSMTLDTPTDGGVCLESQCKPIRNLPLFIAKIILISDDEGVDPDEYDKRKGEITPLDMHTKLNTKAGETYKNRMTIELTPLMGEGETLKWAIDLIITVK